MRKFCIIIMVASVILGVCGCKSNIDWSVEYKDFEVSNKYIDKYFSYLNIGDGLYPRSEIYFITLEDEFGLKADISVSPDQYEWIAEGNWTECSLLNNGGSFSALIPYRIELENYTQDELLDLFNGYPKVEW